MEKNNSKKNLFLLIAWLLLIVVFLFIGFQSKARQINISAKKEASSEAQSSKESLMEVFIKNTQVPASDLYACQTDSDCIAIDTSCCGCLKDQGRSSINKKFESIYQTSKSNFCNETKCDESYQIDSLCLVGPSCINQICTLKAKDINACKKSENEALCLSYFINESPSLSICEAIEDSKQQERCKKHYECEQLNSEKEKANCITELIKKEIDPLLKDESMLNPKE